MREIEFRGVSQLDGKWVYGDCLREYSYKEPDFKTEEEYRNWVDGKINPILTYYYIGCRDENDWELTVMKTPIFEQTLGQYTGLTDKNGTKIFEGDIVKLHLAYYKFIGVVRYEDCQYEVQGHYEDEENKGGTFYLHSSVECEVIGNIYDNPELLEGYLC